MSNCCWIWKQKRKVRINAIKTLGNTIGVGVNSEKIKELESIAIKSIRKAKGDRDRRVKKAADEAMELIENQKSSTLFDMFDGGVGFSKK